jgi:phospholipase D1/2
MSWEYNTICRGGKSILEQLRREFPDVDAEEYFSFHTVKNWGRLNVPDSASSPYPYGSPQNPAAASGSCAVAGSHVEQICGPMLVAEQIYVHAKLLIVDDRVVICGSANINDRSLLGNRDSEIALLIRQFPYAVPGLTEEATTVPFNQRPFSVSRFAHRLRVLLWMEHLGLSPASPESYGLVQDPIAPHTWHNLWLAASKYNSEVYNSIFYKSHQARYTPEAEARLKTVRGHLCEFDQHFLDDSEMRPSITNVDVLVASDDVFT